MASDDDIEGSLTTDIPPPNRPRDQAGKFIREGQKPEPIFGLRPIEGEANEREQADGGEQGDRSTPAEAEGPSRQPRRADSERDRHADADDGYDVPDESPENITAESESDTADGQQVGEREEVDEGPRYEVTVDGEPKEVSLKEALSGYVRQQTFHKRMAELNAIQGNMEVDAGNLQKGWQAWQKARQDYEEDLFALIPKEPNWDEEFARNPQGAHQTQKIYQTLYGKLAASRQARLDRETQDKEEADRRLQKYAVDGFAKFVAMHPKMLPDEATLKKNIQSMRRTAMAAGFSEQEVATVYDPRMLTILLKASKYDRIQANRPKPVVPDKGRTLPPGNATPLSGNAPRKGLDEALRRQASSGRLDDTAEVFRRLL
jgi:hypothetical protein